MHSNIAKLTDAELLNRVKNLTQKEREMTLSILHHLREVERRKLYSTLKYPSLFEYCRHELGYSSGSAQRRIDSMRLLKDIPELEQSVLDGKLSLSTLAQAQVFFRAEQKSAHASAAPKLEVSFKKEILQELKGKSSREVERELLRHASNPEIHFKEKVRPVNETHTELKLILDEETMKNLETLKGRLAHSHPGMSLSDLVVYLAKFGVEKLDPVRERKKKVLEKENLLPASEVKENQSNQSLASGARAVPTLELTLLKQSRYISLPLRRAIFHRDQSKCTLCGSRYGLEMDHIQPFAKNGTNSIENLRLLCRNCNRRHAIESYGLRKIEDSRAG